MPTYSVDFQDKMQSAYLASTDWTVWHRKWGTVLPVGAETGSYNNEKKTHNKNLNRGFSGIPDCLPFGQDQVESGALHSVKAPKNVPDERTSNFGCGIADHRGHHFRL